MRGGGLIARWPHWSGRSAHVITRSLNR
jgi:hypothetical protein